MSKRTVIQGHTVILNSNYECTIDGTPFKVTVINNNGERLYAILSNWFGFEYVIEHKFKLSQNEIYDAHYLPNRRLMHYCPQDSENGFTSVAYFSSSDIIDYLLIILRKLMTMGVDIKVVSAGDECFMNRLKKNGLTVIQHGIELLLYPDLEPFRDEATHDYEDIVDTDEPCVNISVRRKRQLRLDFH